MRIPAWLKSSSFERRSAGQNNREHFPHLTSPNRFGTHSIRGTTCRSRVVEGGGQEERCIVKHITHMRSEGGVLLVVHLKSKSRWPDRLSQTQGRPNKQRRRGTEGHSFRALVFWGQPDKNYDVSYIHMYIHTYLPPRGSNLDENIYGAFGQSSTSIPNGPESYTI